MNITEFNKLEELNNAINATNPNDLMAITRLLAVPFLRSVGAISSLSDVVHIEEVDGNFRLRIHDSIETDYGFILKEVGCFIVSPKSIISFCRDIECSYFSILKLKNDLVEAGVDEENTLITELVNLKNKISTKYKF